MRASQVAWAKRNRAHLREYMASWHEKHPGYRVSYMRAYRKPIKQKLIKIKLDSGCELCGYNEHPAALDFDHVSGEKSFNIGWGNSKSWDELEVEIAKCRVLCANCHRVETFKRRNTLLS